MRLHRLASCSAILTMLCVAAPVAHAERDSSTPALLAAGAGMAIPTYLLGVAWHEGTHALFASSFGADVFELRLYPSVYQGHFYFGLTRWRGGLSDGERAFTLVAPKLTDLVLLGGYTAIIAADALPDNDYGALALTVLATGAWVDFAKDLFSTNPTNDLMKVHAIYGHTTEWQRLPWRLVQGALSAAAGIVLYVGYADVFAAKTVAGAPAMLFQVYAGSF